MIQAEAKMALNFAMWHIHNQLMLQYWAPKMRRIAPQVTCRQSAGRGEGGGIAG